MTGRHGLEIGLRIPACRDAAEVAATAAQAEVLGFDAMWVPDSQLLWRDVFATIALTATGTERIAIGTAVTNVDTRHPTVLASAIRTVQELAPGRFRVGVGGGDSALRPIGRSPTPHRRLRAELETVRLLVEGKAVDFGAGPLRLRDPAGPVPVYVAANGPRNLALAGAYADGVILLSGVSHEALELGLRDVAEGAASVGRDVDALRVVTSAFCLVTDDVERDSRRLKPVCAQIAQTGGRRLLEIAGIRLHVPARVPGVYPDLIHAEDWPAAVEVCSRWVSDADALAFAETFCLFGTAGEVADRIREVANRGVTALLLQQVDSYDLPHALLEAVGGDVLPRLSP